jgi:hypothetical protein
VSSANIPRSPGTDAIAIATIQRLATAVAQPPVAQYAGELPCNPTNAAATAAAAASAVAAAAPHQRKGSRKRQRAAPCASMTMSETATRAVADTVAAGSTSASSRAAVASAAKMRAAVPADADTAPWGELLLLELAEAGRESLSGEGGELSFMGRATRPLSALSAAADSPTGSWP